MSAVKILKKKIMEMVWVIFFFLVWIMGVVAVMVEFLQIEEFILIKVVSFVFSVKKCWKRQVIIKVIEMVDRMIGSEDCLIVKICEILRLKLSKIMVYWSNFLELKVNFVFSCLQDERKG